MPVAALALLLSACTSGSGSPATSTPAPTGTVPNSTSAAPSSSVLSTSPAPAAKPVRMAATPASRDNLNPASPITVSVANGTLRSVQLLNPDGEAVEGALAADKASWHTTEALGYSKTYRLMAQATDPSGEGMHNLRRSYTTVTPSNLTMPYLDTIYGSRIENGATYGVGMIPVVSFDEQVTDKKAAEDAMEVTTSPHVDGAWYWIDDSHAHWRPQRYYQPGTTVTIAANVYGVQVGDGLYGEADQKVSYKIGAKHVAVADAETHHVRVYFDGTLKRTMPTSMGRGGSTIGKTGQRIYFWTMPGVYTVIGHENPATMSSDSYGLPANSPLGYAPEKVPYATKISTDGIYLHELDTTVELQGVDNVSHGCLNLNHDNASWYYNTSRVGDLVKVIHSGGPKLQAWQGGDWSLSWKTVQHGGIVAYLDA